MMDVYSTRQIAAFFGITVQTVRIWAEEFSEYLSEYANPGTNRTRKFTRDDTAVFSLISEKRHMSEDYSRIHADLKSGERGDVILPADEVRAIISSDNEVRLAVQIDHLERQLAMLRDERDKLKEELEASRHHRDENIRLKAQNEGLTARVDALTEEVKRLYREVGRLEGKLEE